MRLLRQSLSFVSVGAALAFAATTHDANAEGDGAENGVIASAVSQVLSYEVWFGGVAVADAKFQMSTDESGYSGVFRLRSDGVLDWFTEAEVQAETTGARSSEGALAPGGFNVSAEVDDEPFTVDVAFSPEGPESVTAEPPFDPRPWEIEPSDQSGALDPLSAFIAAFFPSSDAAICDRSLDIYDGRRRYEVSLYEENRRREKDGFVEVECKARWDRTAGFKPKQMRKPGVEFMVRFRILEDGLTVPVRAWAQTEYGAVVAVID